jgi:VanZ family protein
MLKLIISLRPWSKYIFIGWIIIIITVSSIPSIPTLKLNLADRVFRLDYLLHFCEYGFLGFAAFLTYAGEKFRIGGMKYLLITVGLIIFAFLDELHQKLIPGRSFNIRDILSNITGIVAALIFCMVVFKVILKNKIVFNHKKNNREER